MNCCEEYFEGTFDYGNAKVYSDISMTTDMWLCGLCIALAYCCEGHFEGTLDHGDTKVHADVLVTMAMQR